MMSEPIPQRAATRGRASMPLFAALAVALSACGQRAPAKLDRPTIEALARASAQAAASRDADALCALYTDDAEVRLVQVRFSGSEVQTLAKPQFCEVVRAGYAALPPQASVSTSVDLQSVDIAADGRSADVTVEVTEELALGGRSMRQSRQQTATVVLAAGGQARFSRVSARIVAQ